MIDSRVSPVARSKDWATRLKVWEVPDGIGHAGRKFSPIVDMFVDCGHVFGVYLNLRRANMLGWKRLTWAHHSLSSEALT